MRVTVPLQANSVKAEQSNPFLGGGVLQRKYSCGLSKSTLDEKCDECQSPTLQRKLTIGASNDPLEKEADRLADEVLAMPEHSASKDAPPLTQRFSGQPVAQSDEVPASVEKALSSPGRPLEPGLQRNMEARFGRDFSQVRVHSGPLAQQSAREVNATAYTVGHDVVFGADQYAPRTQEGRRLIAHELVHVVQQSAADEISVGESNDQRGPSPILASQDNKQLALPTNISPETIFFRQDSKRLLVQRNKAVLVNGATTEKEVAHVAHKVEDLLHEFSSASGDKSKKNAAAMKAVRAVIDAYNLSEAGLVGMKFNPRLKIELNMPTAVAATFGEKDHTSRIEFGPESFNQGFSFLVYIVAHELEHVRQNLIGGDQGARNDPNLIGGFQGARNEAVKEFLAYSGGIRQVGPVAGPGGKGLIGTLMTKEDLHYPALPKLEPKALASEALQALKFWRKMSNEDRRRYRDEFVGTRDRLFERIHEEAPRSLKPPERFTAEWRRWLHGIPDDPPKAEPFSSEYQEWAAAYGSDWHSVREAWKEFNAYSGWASFG